MYLQWDGMGMYINSTPIISAEGLSYLCIQAISSLSAAGVGRENVEIVSEPLQKDELESEGAMAVVDTLPIPSGSLPGPFRFLMRNSTSHPPRKSVANHDPTLWINIKIHDQLLIID